MKLFSSYRLPVVFATLIFILIIITIALVLGMGSGKDGPLLAQDTPEGTVQRFLLAIKSEDYAEAYSYISPMVEYPGLVAPGADETLSYEKWRKRFSRSAEQPGWKVTLGESSITGSEASVDVIVDVFEPIQIDQGQYALFVITPGGRKRSVNDLVDPAPIQNAAK